MQLVHAGHRVLAPAVLAGDAGIALERAGKASKAQLRLAGSSGRDQLLDLLFDRLIVQLIGLDGCLSRCLGLLCVGRRHLRGRNAAVQLALLGLHLAVLGVQIRLLALQLGALVFQLCLVAFQLDLVRFQIGLGGLHVVHDLGILHRDILHDLVEGQQLIQVVHGAEHGDAAAVPQLLHGGHVLFEIAPLAVDLGLLVGDLAFLFGDLGFLAADLLLGLADAVLHGGDLAAENGDLILDDAHPLGQLTFQCLGGRLLLFGVGKFFFVLVDGLGKLVQLVLQAGHAGGCRGGVHRDAEQQAGCCHAQADTPHKAGTGRLRLCVPGSAAGQLEPERLCMTCFFHVRLPFLTRSGACGWRTCCPDHPRWHRLPGCR